MMPTLLASICWVPRRQTPLAERAVHTQTSLTPLHQPAPAHSMTAYMPRGGCTASCCRGVMQQAPTARQGAPLATVCTSITLPHVAASTHMLLPTRIRADARARPQPPVTPAQPTVNECTAVLQDPPMVSPVSHQGPWATTQKTRQYTCKCTVPTWEPAAPLL
jgi:hypothetical protein